MQLIVALFVLCAIVLIILAFAFGPIAVLIGLGVIILTLTILAIFTLGIWYAHTAIRFGAKMALEAQTHNDRWDAAKTQTLSQFGREILRLRDSGRQGQNGLPMLPIDEDEFDFPLLLNDETGAGDDYDN